MYRPETAIDVPWTSRHFWAGARRSVPLNVWLLGLTSLLTDVSSEMVVSVLPAYLVLGLHLSPLTYGALDGLYSGATVLTRWMGGAVSDLRRRYKDSPSSATACRRCVVRAWCWSAAPPAAIAGVIAADRVGKGLRSAPRDALISLSAPAETLAQAFGVHRALDATGALLGPLVAVWLLSAIPGAYDVVFVTSFAIALVGVGVLATFVRDVRGRSARQPPARRSSPRSRCCGDLMSAHRGGVGRAGVGDDKRWADLCRAAGRCPVSDSLAAAAVRRHQRVVPAALGAHGRHGRSPGPHHASSSSDTSRCSSSTACCWRRSAG